MRREWIERLACPRTRASYDLDPIRVAGDEVVEAFLVSRDEREVRPVLAGVAVLPRDLPAHLHTQGNVYRRTPVNDPRLARFVLARAGSGYVVVPFDEVVASYRDLTVDAPEGYERARPPEHAALAALAAARDGARGGVGLVVGCGVGRAVFDLNEHHDAVLGVDRSLACVRRARNVAVTREHFFLPAPKGSGAKEIPLDLEGIERAGVDFAVADGGALPLADGVCDTVVVFPADALGPWEDPRRVVAEACRVLRPGGRLIRHETLAGAAAAAQREGPWRAGSPA